MTGKRTEAGRPMTGRRTGAGTARVDGAGMGCKQKHV